MLEHITIENFKSIKKLDIDVGRFNVIIGENGAGKSNFLEALAIYSAVEDQKFDSEFLASRGIRYSQPKLLNSLFENDIDNFSIEISTNHSNVKQKAIVTVDEETLDLNESNVELFSYVDQKLARIRNHFVHGKEINLELPEYLSSFFTSNNSPENKIDSFEILRNILENMNEKEKNKFTKDIKVTIKNKNLNLLNRFLIYSPENTALRNLEKEGQISPLGINGEGLFKLLQRMKNEDIFEKENDTVYKDSFEDVIQCVTKFDWIDSIQISDSTNPLDHKITINDRYLISELDQRSANEGFLFVLFYATLFCSKLTPKVFSIDNIDASLNPKMCKELITILIHLSKKYDKQVFVTTHNPAILDGLNLYDPDQALLVVKRNSDGHTKLKRLCRDNLPAVILNSSEELRLSEAFIRGYLGGLPKNF